MSFIPLHIISGYSLLKSGLSIDSIVKIVNKQGYLGLGITDYTNLSAVPPLIKEFDKYKKGVAIGISFPLDGDIICLFAKDEEGYRNIVKLSSLYQKDNSFDIAKYLKDNHNGLLAILETCYGEFHTRFINDHTSHDFESYLYRISSLFDEFYLGLEAKNVEEREEIKLIKEFANNHSYETVAFPRIRYQKKEDAIVIDILSAIENNSQLDIKEKSGYEYLMEEKYYYGIYGKEDVEKTETIFNSLNANLHQKRGGLLSYPVNDSKEELRSLCKQGLERLNKIDDQKYLDRLNYELSVIESLHYEDYFLIVQDYVKYAKEHNILVGPGRGSAAGSLVSYCLNITTVDPVKYGLLFERFLNSSRKTMPDIDVDFMDIKRGDVIEYIKNRYGKDKVAIISTFQTIQAKQSIRDIGRVYDFNPNHIDLLSKLLTEQVSLAEAYRNIPAFKKYIDGGPVFLSIVSLASKIEGLPRQKSSHASGIILNNSALDDAIPTYYDKDNDTYYTQYEDKYLEEQGCLKMDILSLGNLTTIYECIQSVNKREGNVLDYANIPYDIPETYQIIASGKTAGIFQLESRGMNRAIKMLKPKCFEDIAVLLALYRPGPMEELETYVKRRNGQPYKIIDERLKDILESTMGIIIYQEQISQIAVAIAGFSLNEADDFRSAVSKKKKELLQSLKDKFIDGAIKGGMNNIDAVNLFKQIEKFDNYGLNKAHATSYAVTSSIMAYLKAKYPLDFYKALFATKTSINDFKFANYLSELSSFGYKILPPDINRSTKEFIVDEKGLLFPLSSIKNLSDIAVGNILEERKNGPFTSFFEFVSRMYPYKLSQSSVEKLIDSGALDAFANSRMSMTLSLPTSFNYAKTIYGINEQLIDKSLYPTPVLVDCQDTPKEKLAKEYDAIYMMLSNNPLEYMREELSKKGVTSIKEADNKNTHVAGIIKNIKMIRTKKTNSQMAYVLIFDETDEIEVIMFSDVYDNVAAKLKNNAIIEVKGYIRVDKQDNEKYSLIAQSVELLGD